ncbi:MAG TPA: RNA polymerase subunit sigma-24 [Microscillaceae bacterium]|jgi:RNA polymerase sigma-70 factor (ECF subfamily)|nr:RNA polymerase subunit sigma-24 [Microscillaceae bacterium]
MRQTEEFLLIDQVLSGSPDAFRPLIAAYKSLVYQLAYKILNNREDAEEVAQDSFLKAYQQLATFQRQCKFSTWLYQITHRLSLNKRKQQQRNPSYSSSDIDHQTLPEGESSSTLAQLSADEQKHYLQVAMAKLSSEDQVLLTLYYLQEQNMEEIEHITGIGRNLAKVKVHRARQKLQGILSKLLKTEINEWL